MWLFWGRMNLVERLLGAAGAILGSTATDSIPAPNLPAIDIGKPAEWAKPVYRSGRRHRSEILKRRRRWIARRPVIGTVRNETTGKIRILREPWGYDGRISGAIA